MAASLAPSLPPLRLLPPISARIGRDRRGWAAWWPHVVFLVAGGREGAVDTRHANAGWRMD